MFNLKSKLRRNFSLLLFADIALFIIAYGGSYFLRFDLTLPYTHYLNFRNTLIPILLLKVFIFYQFGLYLGMWRYTSLKDLENIIKASILSSSAIIIIILMTSRFVGFPRSIFVIDCILTIFLIGGFRLGIRLFFQYNKQGLFTRNKNKTGSKKRKKLIIIGAGDAGEKILREINDNAGLTYQVIGFLDDDPKKIDRYIHGVKVLDGN